MAQSTGDYRSNAVNMDWNNASAWQTWDTGSNSWITATEAPTSMSQYVTILPAHTVNITGDLQIDQLIIKGTLKNRNRIIINDDLGNDVHIEPGGKFINEGSNASVVNRGKWIMNDSVLNRAAASFFNEGILINNGACFKNNGTLVNAGHAVLVNSGDFLSGGKITFENKSTYQHSFESTQPTAGTIPTATWEEGSVCEILACGNAFQPGALNQVFHHFIWNNSTQPHDFNLIANPNQVNGNFEIKNTNGNRLTYKGSAAGKLMIGDSLKITGGLFVLTNGTAAAGIEATTYYQQAGTLDMSTSSAPGTISVSAAFTHIGGTFQHSGTSDSCVIILKGAGASTMESIGFREEDTFVIQIKKNSQTGCCFIPIQASLVLRPGTQLQVMDNTLSPVDLQVDGTLDVYSPSWNLKEGHTRVNGKMINRSSVTGAGISSVNSLQFSSSSSYVHTGDGGQLPLAMWDPASIIEITGLVQATEIQNSGQSFGNIHWNNSQQKQPCIFGAPGFEVKGNYTIENTGNTYLCFPDYDFSISGNLTLRATSVLQLSATAGLFHPLKRRIRILGNVTVLDAASLRVGHPSANVNISGSDVYRDYELELSKDFIYTSTASLIGYHHCRYPAMQQAACYRLQLTFSGNCLQHIQVTPQPAKLIQLSPDEFVSHNVFAIRVAGTGTTLEPSLYQLCTNKIEIDAGDTLNISKQDIQILQYAVRNFSGTAEAPAFLVHGTLDLGRNIIKDENSSGLFQLNSGATLKTMHPEGIESSANTGCIWHGNRIFEEGANYEYNGNQPQVTGSGLPASISGRLTINNSTLLKTGGVHLTNAILLTGTLQLIQGKLISSASHLLSMANTSAIIPTGGSNGSFIEGPIKKIGSDAAVEFIFPTGDKDKWARIGIKPTTTSVTDTYTASYRLDNPMKIGNYPLDAELDHISSKEYWRLDQANGTAAVGVKLFWESGNFSGIHSIAANDLKITRLDTLTEKTWKSELKNTTFSGTFLSGSIQSTSNLKASNVFTFGSSLTLNPLPVELLSFSGKNTSKGTVLTWITASEKNNQTFSVQRSGSGNRFSQIALVSGQGNSMHVTTYSYTDTAAAENLMYYRLKQIDNDGKYSYSPVIRVENKEGIQELIIYPNPCSTGNIHIAASSSVVRFIIYNLLGKIIYEGGANTVDYLFKPEGTGIYFIKAFVTDGRTITKKLVVN